MTQQTPQPQLHSGLSVELHDEHGEAIRAKATLLLSENKASVAKQYRVDTDGDDPLTGRFPPGDYSLQAFAVGYGVGRDFVRIGPDHVTKITLRLAPAPAQAPVPTLAERLAVYGLSPQTAHLGDLHVKDRKRVVLDYKQYPHADQFTVLRPKSIQDLKRWVGSKPKAFGHDAPRFGPLPAVTARRLQSQVSLAPTDRAALQALAREYIYGNVRSVTQFETLLNGYISWVASTILVPIFHYNVVTIDNGAVLEAGNGSSVFFCDVLRVQTNGTFLVVGDLYADIGTYEQFA
jgi:hypothetical protein